MQTIVFDERLFWYGPEIQEIEEMWMQSGLESGGFWMCGNDDLYFPHVAAYLKRHNIVGNVLLCYRW